LLASYLNGPSTWKHLREEAPKYAAEWSDVAMATRLATLYRELAGAHAESKVPQVTGAYQQAALEQS
jgi:hypothetical protein